MSKQALTLPQIAKRAGIGYRTLKSWESQGLIVPSIARNDTGKPGCPDLYSEQDAQVAISLVNLRRRGLDMTTLRVVAAAWRAGRLPECPICHRADLKVPVIDHE